jgi:hypothetical protein
MDKVYDGEFKFRKVERETPEGWENIAFSDLKVSDRFKLYDDDTVADPLEDGSRVYVATSAAYPCPPPEGNYGIEFQDA